jgi:hypothetical protein
MERFGTQVPKIKQVLISPTSLEECAEGVQRRIWREKYRLKKAVDPVEINKKRSDIGRLTIIKNELTELLNQL